MIDHISTEKHSSRVLIAFFFPRFEDSRSLKADTALRCITRQLLQSSSLSEKVEASLNSFASSSELKYRELLQTRTEESDRVYIIIDGLDEFGKSERRSIFATLSSISCTTHVKIFLTGRESISEEVCKYFPSFEHILMGNPTVHSAIATYIDSLVQAKLDSAELIVGDSDLVADVKKALTKGADGM